jgi:hypothetical protein
MRRAVAGKPRVYHLARRFLAPWWVFTTLPATEATGAEVVECYRQRWQIELTFKRLKSIDVPKQTDASSRAWLQCTSLRTRPELHAVFTVRTHAVCSARVLTWQHVF